MNKKKKYRLKSKYKPKNIIRKFSRKKRHRYRIKNSIVILFLVICLGLFVFSIYHIIKWRLDNNENKKINDEIVEKVIKDDRIDFKALLKINPDTVGYLKVKNTNINYAVVKQKDNRFYLTHNFKKEYNIAGWIFVDYRNQVDGTDKNITIYGHNMRDGSMFGSLKKTLYSDWYGDKENLKISFDTPKDNYIYEVFSLYRIKKEEYYTKNTFESDKEYESFLNKLKERSYVNFDKKLSSKDKIITLSTCDTNNKYRIILHAVLK